MTVPMNSSRSSRVLALCFALVLAVGVAGAVSVTDNAPSEAQVGTTVEATFELTELYSEYESWQLQGQTELSNVTWTVEEINAADAVIQGESGTYDGQRFAHPVDIDSGAVRVQVTVTGTAPTVENYTYDPAEEFVVASLVQARQNGTSAAIGAARAHHYTEDSQQARQAIEDAEAAIAEAGGHDEAERTVGAAISAYENENFENAVNLATQAEETASQARASQGRTQLILMGVGALILLGIIIGGVLYWRSTRTTSRL